MADIAGMMDAREIKSADFLLILNRNDNIIPGVAKLNRDQAAAYFMLGETRGTSAGGAAEAGKFLRVPGTNPFFPLKHAAQGNRFRELLESSPMEVYLMNTGRVGGRDEDERSRKVRIQHSSAIVKGVAEGTIQWEADADFGYQVAASVPDLGDDDMEILQPRRLYRRQGRMDEYNQIVERLKAERREYMAKWDGLDPEIVRAIE
jgi:phosphoenolpyruvate carboxykinase (ATP)